MVRRLQVTSLLLAMLILSTIFVSTVSAKNIVDSDTTKDKQLEIARQLWGTDITNGEYIKQVFPEAYDESPDAATKAYYEMKMIWIDPMKNNEEISESSINSTLAKTIYLVAANGKVEKSSSTKISFSSYEKMVLPSPTTPIPQMAQTTQVFRKSGTSAVLVGASYKSGTNVYQISTSGSISYVSGDYKIITQSTAVWPPGCEPPTWYAVKDSGWKHL